MKIVDIQSVYGKASLGEWMFYYSSHKLLTLFHLREECCLFICMSQSFVVVTENTNAYLYSCQLLGILFFT